MTARRERKRLGARSLAAVGAEGGKNRCQSALDRDPQLECKRDPLRVGSDGGGEALVFWLGRNDGIVAVVALNRGVNRQFPGGAFMRACAALGICQAFTSYSKPKGNADTTA